MPINLLSMVLDKKTVVIICAVLGSVALIGFVIWYVRKKKYCSETKGEFWKRTLIQFSFEGVSVAVFPTNVSLVPPPTYFTFLQMQ